MPPPFYRTVQRTRKKDVLRIVPRLFAISLRAVLKRLKKVPYKAIMEVNNEKMLLYPCKGGIHYDLFLHGKREPMCTDYLRRSGIVKDGDVVLDIGANIGYYALMESQLVGNRGKVYAVEPVSGNYEVLKKNVRLNGLENIQTFRLACGEVNCESKIYVSSMANLCAIKQSTVGGDIIGEEEVSMVKVDSFLQGKEPPNLIRMDVEGYEYEIIRGMPQTLKGDVKILVELHTIFLRRKLDEFLGTLALNGFRARFVVFEEKVEANRIVRVLMKTAGDALPIIATNLSIQELKKLLKKNVELAPNVVFEKAHRSPVD